MGCHRDTFYWGTLEGVGRVYVEAVIDVSCRNRLAPIAPGGDNEAAKEAP